ncbi:MAG: hypothetical protein GKR77_05940 [Legionellales bacterium]|nr:hypothetical protein [Legionellales bacterium]
MKKTIQHFLGGLLLLPFALAAHAAPDVEVLGKTITFAIPTADKASQVICELTTKSHKEFVDNKTVAEMYHGKCRLLNNNKVVDEVRTRISFRQFPKKPTEFKLRTEVPRDSKTITMCRITGEIDKKIKRNSSKRELNFTVKKVHYVCGNDDQGTSVSVAQLKKHQIDPQLSVKVKVA